MPSSDLHRHLIQVAPLPRSERQRKRDTEIQREAQRKRKTESKTVRER